MRNYFCAEVFYSNDTIPKGAQEFLFKKKFLDRNFMSDTIAVAPPCLQDFYAQIESGQILDSSDFTGKLEHLLHAYTKVEKKDQVLSLKAQFVLDIIQKVLIEDDIFQNVTEDAEQAQEADEQQDDVQDDQQDDGQVLE